MLHKPNRYRRRPEVLDAMKVTPASAEYVLHWVYTKGSGLGKGITCELLKGTGIRIGEKNKEGTVVAHYGDYLVKCGPRFYVWKKEKFEAAFDLI